jgi:hypothetical protein
MVSIRIKFRDPLDKTKILTFTTKEYSFDVNKNVYVFVDKFGVRQEWVKDLFIGTEGMNRTEGDENEN